MGCGIIASGRRRSGGVVVTFGALVHKSTGDQIFGAGGGPQLDWDTETYDAGGWHSTSSNTSRLTVPSGVSLVRVTSNILSNASGDPLLSHNLNGATFRGMGKSDTNNGGSEFVNIGSAPIAVTAGDYLETIFEISGGTTAPSNNEETWMAIEKLDASTKYALVYHSASQSLSAGTNTVLAFNSEVTDTDGFHDTSTNNSRLTVPAALNGKAVRLCANACGGNVTGQFALTILKNGVSARGLPFRDCDTASEDNVNTISAPMIVATGDYFQVNAFTTSATSVPTGNSIWFSIEEVPATYKRALVYKTGNQTIPATTTTILTWDAEEYDTDGLHDTSTNNSRLTVPTGCTRARPIIGIHTSSVSNQAVVNVQKNGADYFGMPKFDTDTAGTDNLSAIGAWVDVTPGDYFEAALYSDNGCTVGADNETWFCLECQ